MKFYSHFATKSATGAIAAVAAFGAVWVGPAQADPGQDNVANFNELSKQAQLLLENVQTAQADLNQKVQLLGAAERRHADDLAALGAARAQLGAQQAVVDHFAAAMYMGGRTDGVTAIFTAKSPANLMERLTVQRAMFDSVSEQMLNFRQIEQEAQTVEAASAESAANAKVAADIAAGVRAELQKKQEQLQMQVALVKATYGGLSPAEQAVLGPGAAIPTVGMSGLVPNARSLAAYIVAKYPGVESIGGVRADPLPDHPSGHAIDIMTGSNMALGDAINADIQSQMGRWNVAYTMWRVPAHFNHVHVTVF